MYFWELKVVTEFPDEKDIRPTEVTFIDEEEFKDRFWFEDNVNEEAVLWNVKDPPVLNVNESCGTEKRRL